MKKVSLTLNGKTACIGGPGRKTQEVIAFIKAIPNGKYFNTSGIGECLKRSGGSIQQVMGRYIEEVEGHYLYVPGVDGAGKSLVYGSKAGIVALRKQLQDAGLI